MTFPSTTAAFTGNGNQELQVEYNYGSFKDRFHTPAGKCLPCFLPFKGGGTSAEFTLNVALQREHHYGFSRYSGHNTGVISSQIDRPVYRCLHEA